MEGLKKNQNPGDFQEKILLKYKERKDINVGGEYSKSNEKKTHEMNKEKRKKTKL